MTLLIRPPMHGFESECGDVSPNTGRHCMAVSGHRGGHEWTDGAVWSTWPNDAEGAYNPPPNDGSAA